MSKSQQSDVQLYSRFSDIPYDIPAVCLVDTNVFLGAGPQIHDWDEGQLECAQRCLKAMTWIQKKTIKSVVLDGSVGASEIFEEYCSYLGTELYTTDYNGTSSFSYFHISQK